MLQPIFLLLSFMLFLITTPLEGADPIPEPPTPDTFAYGMKLIPSISQPLYHFPLPDPLYRHVSKANLGDLRIFNSHGEIVPHLIQPAISLSKEEIERFPLPLFPISGSPEDPLPNNITFMVKRNSVGSILDLKIGEEDTASKKQHVLFYLLDCTPLEQGLGSLEIFADNEQADFYQRIIVEESNDLINWSRRGSATLATLQHLDHTLVNRTINLPPKKYRYLRIAPTGPPSPFTIHEVIGLRSHTISGSTGEPRSFSLAPVTQSTSPSTYLFDAGGLFPLNQIQINLAQPNSMAEARLLSGPLEKGPMGEVWRGLVYYLTREEAEFRNEPIFLSPNKHRYWKVEFKHSEVTPAPPQLYVSYLPDQLFFLGSGEGPFTLAYGNPRIHSPSFGMEELLRKYRRGNDMEPAASPIIIDKEFILGGPERLLPPPRPLPWKQYMLWLVLLIGTGLVAKMSISIYKQMNKGKKEI